MKKVIILGVGNFGISWANGVLPACSDVAELAAVVDRDPERLQKIPDTVPKYADINAAIAAVQPDLVINVTPPSLHTDLNIHLLEMGLNVLCEKPIAAEVADAKRMESYLAAHDGFLMIGENYRYSAIFRRVRAILDSGELGPVRNGQCQFRHYHADYSMYYHGKLAHPLLTDVSIHHLDVARYLLGEEPVKVFAKESSAPYAWYGDRPATANIIAEMTNGVTFNYFGTLAASVTQTEWNGDWQIECEKGNLLIRNDKLYITRGEGDRRTEEFIMQENSDSRAEMLREALAAIGEGRKGETDFSDNMKTFLWLHKCIESSDRNEMVAI